MKSTLMTAAAAAVALSMSVAAPAFAQVVGPETPMGYTDDGRLNVFGARIDPRSTDADGRGDGPIVNGPAAGYGIPRY